MKKILGMTFLEVLIAVVITGMILVSMLTCVNFAVKYARHNANKTMALNSAAGLLEEIIVKGYEDQYASNADYHAGPYNNFLGPEKKSEDTGNDDDDMDNNGIVEKDEYDDVDDYNGYEDTVDLYQTEGSNVTADINVAVSDQNDSSTLDETGYAGITYKKVTITVGWDWQGTHYEEIVNTIRTKY